MKLKILTLAAVCIVLFLFIIQVNVVEGVSAKTWKQDKFTDFIHGKPSQTEIKSDGRIYMAPEIKSIYKIQDREYIWASVTDSVGNVIVATGPKAAIYKISPAGKEIWKIALEGIEATAIAIDKKDNVYAGVSPDGIIYRISSSGKSEQYFKTEQKYIWALCFDSKGNLFAGTGVKGNIFKVTSANQGAVFAKLPDVHITALTVNQKDELIGGTDDNAYIFKVDQTGKVFILYDAPEREIKSIYIDEEGSILATAIRKSFLIDKTILLPLKSEKKEEKTKSDDSEESENDSKISITSTTSTSKVKLVSDDEDEEVEMKEYRSKLYKIDKNNQVTELIYTTLTTLFDIVSASDTSALVCGGAKGRIYKVFSPDNYSLMLEVDNKHLTSMAKYKNNIYICASNEAEIYLLEDSFPEQAAFFSDVLDMGNVSKLGTIKWNAITPQDTTIRLFTRSGNTENPDETWSSWSTPYLVSEGSKIESPSARYVQWKASLMTSNRKNSPVIDSVTVSYLPMNDAPMIMDYKLSIKGIALKERNEPGDSDPRLDELENIISASKPVNENDQPMTKNLSTSKDYYQEGALSLIWKAKDPNGDNMLFSLAYKGETEKEWKQLVKDYRKNFYTWDTKAIPDGVYRIKIVASDSLDTPDNFALESRLITEPITVDNTGPVISKPMMEIKSSAANIIFNVKDNLSPIVKCKYSVNGGEWKIIFPDDQINDTLKEDYKLILKLEKKGEYNITFQAIDSENNISTTSASFDY